MSETVRELYERERERLKVLWARTNPELILKDGSLMHDAEAVVAEDVVEALMDYHILPESRCVVDAATVDAIAERVNNDPRAQEVISVTIEHNRRGDEARVLDVQVDYRTIVLAVLEAADIAVADEVVEVGEDDCDDPIPAQLRVLLPGDEEYSFLDFDPGDTLYIKRAVTADRHSKEGDGLPPDYPPAPDVLGFPDATSGDNDEGWEDERAAAEEQAYSSGHEAGYGEGFNDARARFDRGDC